jgi:hypothetical protein
MCIVSRNIFTKPLAEGSPSITSPDVTVQVVPTFRVETAPQQIDIASLTSSDLDSLKVDDAFMYYSIPSEKRAALKHDDEQDFETTNASSNTITATRRTRLSTECHPDLLLEELFNDEEFMSSFNALSVKDDDSSDDLVYDYLLSLNEATHS